MNSQYAEGRAELAYDELLTPQPGLGTNEAHSDCDSASYKWLRLGLRPVREKTTCVASVRVWQSKLNEYSSRMDGFSVRVRDRQSQEYKMCGGPVTISSEHRRKGKILPGTDRIRKHWSLIG
eukprot:sb/3475962/